jgi:hypothetical protein
MLTEKDVLGAFRLAQEGMKPIVVFVTHDYYKNAAEELGIAHALMMRAAQKYPNIRWRYENALTAARESLSLLPLEGLKFSVTKEGKNKFSIASNHMLFGPMPYVVVDCGTALKRVDVEPIGVNTWRLTPEDKEVEEVGVAGADAYGNSAVVVKRL